MATAEHVIRESNLIARNFECLGPQAAALATADHMTRFWAPYLKSVLLKEARDHRDRFSALAREAISILARHTAGTGDTSESQAKIAVASSIAMPRPASSQGERNGHSPAGETKSD